MEMEMDAPTIKLESSDAMIFPTEVRVAKLFVTIKNMLECFAVEDDENAVVPLRSGERAHPRQDSELGRSPLRR